MLVDTDEVNCEWVQIWAFYVHEKYIQYYRSCTNCVFHYTCSWNRATNEPKWGHGVHIFLHSFFLIFDTCAHTTNCDKNVHKMMPLESKWLQISPVNLIIDYILLRFWTHITGNLCAIEVYILYSHALCNLHFFKFVFFLYNVMPSTNLAKIRSRMSFFFRRFILLWNRQFI